MRAEIPKRIKRQLRELVARAYETEMNQALEELHVHFEHWKRGEIDAFELNEEIHRHHNGVARDLYKKYNNSDLPLVVAGVIYTGIICREDVPTEVLEFEAVLGSLRFLEAIDERERMPKH